MQYVMYKKHIDLEEVPRHTIIWQYMPLSKFICLLREEKLYFNRVDNFKDKRECTLTAIDKKIFRFTKDAECYWERERKRHFINCWLESDYELALMWDTYGKDGVAIKTTVGNLIDSLAVDSEHHQYLSRVKYLDEKLDCSQDWGTPNNVLKIPLSKRKFYEQEREIRLLYTREETDEQKGISFSVDLNCLISEVRVYPDAPPYFLEVVKKELQIASVETVALFSEV